MAERTAWSSTWRYVVGVAVCMLLGWYAFVRGAAVPVLSLVDLGFHELGHLLAAPLPELLTAAAGSVFQVMVPVGLALYFWLRPNDRMAAGLCLAWAGASAQQVAVYVADAPTQLLPLIGGEHDWAYILGRLGLMHRADTLATIVLWFGASLVVGGIVACLWGLSSERRRPAEPSATAPAWETASR
jgi:hypothetical protein